MAHDAQTYYDRYWPEKDIPRTEARSQERARIAVGLLRGRGAGAPEGERNSDTLLDLGCGPGLSLEVFRAADYEVAGADASAVAVDEVRELGFRAALLDLENVAPDAFGEFFHGPPGNVVALEVLEHLIDPLGLLVRLRGYLPATTPVVVSLPNEIHLLARLRVLFGVLPFGGHADPHVRHFDRTRAKALFAAAGYRVTASRAVHILPPGRRLLRTLTQPALWLAPGCFSLATVYLLEAESA